MMRRTFGQSFKIEICRQVESGDVSKSRCCREHALSPSMLDRWILQYRAKGEDAFSGSDWRAISQAPEAKIRELESSLGRAHMEIEFLQEALGKLRPGSGRKSP